MSICKISLIVSVSCVVMNPVSADPPDESRWLPIASKDDSPGASLLHRIRDTGSVVLSEPTPGATFRSGDLSAFTVIGLPDTQNYSELYPEIFLDQTQWVASQRYLRDIRYVNHYGDVVQHADISAARNSSRPGAL